MLQCFNAKHFLGQLFHAHDQPQCPDKISKFIFGRVIDVKRALIPLVLLELLT